MTEGERLSRLEDLAAIEQLRNRYCLHVDLEQWREAAALFAEDGAYIGALGQADGRAAIEALFAASVPGHMKRAWHHTHNAVTELSGDRATGVVSHELFFIMNRRPKMALGRYEDDYRKEGGKWLFARRKTIIDVHCDWQIGFHRAERVGR